MNSKKPTLIARRETIQKAVEATRQSIVDNPADAGSAHMRLTLLELMLGGCPQCNKPARRRA